MSAKPWTRFSTSRRFSSNSQRDEVQEITFGRGTNSYQDGPEHDFRLARGLVPEADFLELARLVENGAEIMAALRQIRRLLALPVELTNDLPAWARDNWEAADKAARAALAKMEA